MVGVCDRDEGRGGSVLTTVGVYYRGEGRGGARLTSDGVCDRVD